MYVHINHIHCILNGSKLLYLRLCGCAWRRVRVTTAVITTSGTGDVIVTSGRAGDVIRAVFFVRTAWIAILHRLGSWTTFILEYK